MIAANAIIDYDVHRSDVQGVNMATHIVIPARLNSRRLPGKMLLDINGKSLIRRTYEVASVAELDSITIATDSVDIRDHCQDFANKICMTSTSHQSGTERVGEVVDLFDFDDDDIVINLQGDEPLLPSDVLIQLAESLSYHRSASMATVATPIKPKPSSLIQMSLKLWLITVALQCISAVRRYLLSLSGLRHLRI